MEGGEGVASEGERSPAAVGGAQLLKNSLIRVKIKIRREVVEEAQEGVQREGALEQVGKVGKGRKEAEDRVRAGEEKGPEGEEEAGEEVGEDARSLSDGATTAEDATTCFLCGKSFPSRKSLYGHMRCHPDRKWRGVTPPPATKIMLPGPKSGDENDSSSAGHDPSALNWLTTQKRGRKGTKHHSPCSPCFEDAVRNLLHIANGHHNYIESEMMIDVRIEETDATFDGGQPSNLTDVNLDSENMETCKDFDETDKIPEVTIGHNEDEDSQEHNHDPFDNKRKRKAKELEVLHKPSYKTPPRNRRYRCNTCNRSFPTHQALGGHKASHKKEKHCLEKASAAGGDTDVGDLSSMENLPTVTTEHRCDQCGMVFSSGQALGGHKRKHWTGYDSSTTALSKEHFQQLLQPMGAVPPCHESSSVALSPGNAQPSASMVEKLAAALSMENAEWRRPWFESSAAAAAAAASSMIAHCHLPEPGNSSSKDGSQQHGSGNNGKSAVSPERKANAKVLPLPTARDFDLNEMPKEQQDEEEL